MSHFFLTGATGFVGGHLAEALVEYGQQVSALVQPQSNTELLQRLGVAVHRGEITDGPLLRDLLGDVDVLVHAAAFDCGPSKECRRVNVEGTHTLLDAAKGQALSRFVVMSSTAVYGARHHQETDETAPLPARHADDFAQAKLEAEQLALRYYRDYEVPAVILRAGHVYGPFDRTTVPRIIDGLHRRTIRYPGGGSQALDTLYVGNLVQAVLLAAEVREAVGQAYNITDGEYVSKRRFVEAVADALGLPHPAGTMPLWWARLRTALHGRHAGGGPWEFSRSWLRFFGHESNFSIDKARRDLGYYPRHTFEDGMYLTMRWFQGRDGRDGGAGSEDDANCDRVSG
jgi:nucleoside-diphosphate-sugar epimerase